MKMFNKSFVLAASAFALLLSFAACSSDSSSTGVEDDPTSVVGDEELVLQTDYGSCYLGTTRDAAYLRLDYKTPVFKMGVKMVSTVMSNSIDMSAEYTYTDLPADFSETQKDSMYKSLCSEENYATLGISDAKCADGRVSGKMKSIAIPTVGGESLSKSELIEGLSLGLVKQCRSSIESMDEKVYGIQSTSHYVTACKSSVEGHKVTQTLRGLDFVAVMEMTVNDDYSTDVLEYYTGISDLTLGEVCASYMTEPGISNVSCDGNTISYHSDPEADISMVIAMYGFDDALDLLGENACGLMEDLAMEDVWFTPYFK